MVPRFWTAIEKLITFPLSGHVRGNDPVSFQAQVDGGDDPVRLRDGTSDQSAVRHPTPVDIGAVEASSRAEGDQRAVDPVAGTVSPCSPSS